MLQTINLYVIYHTFICDKPMVYSKQTYGLHRLNQWFITYKPIVLTFPTFCLPFYH